MRRTTTTCVYQEANVNLRRILIGGAIGVGGAIAMASVAWACASVTNPAGITVVTPDGSRALAGTVATIHGYKFDPGPIRLTWGRDPAVKNNPVLPAVDGPVTAADDGTFTARVTIPAVAPAVYYIIGYPDPRTDNMHADPAPFRVLARQTDPAIIDPKYKNSDTVTVDGLFPADATTDPGGNGGSQAPAPINATVGAALPGVVATPAAGSSANLAVGLDRPGGVAGSVPLGAVASPSLVDSTVAGLATLSPDDSGLPSSKSFGRDLWSGFTRGAGPTQAPSLLDAPSSGHTPGLALGMGLALAATVALCMGFGLAEVQRRRALA
jgi:hypothetical protein